MKMFDFLNGLKQGAVRRRIYMILFIVSTPFIIIKLYQNLEVIREMGFRFGYEQANPNQQLLSQEDVKNEIKKLTKINNQKAKILNKAVEGENYIVINTIHNRFKLYNNKGKMIRDGLCSSGSYVKLKLNHKKAWLFRTPRGMYKVLNKVKSPVWAKPDWAFIEEGLPIPKPGSPDRFEAGSMGDYALNLGDGYKIHGTLYQRFLGMAVTHGCIRLGDEDLETVFNTLKVGSKVFIL